MQERSPTAVPEPTERELRILQILWERGEASVREVYEALREELGIAQNTAQTFLRTMNDKGLVTFRKEGRSFIYRPLVEAGQTRERLVGGLLRRAFDGAIDQLVASAVAVRKPSTTEIERLRSLLAELEGDDGRVS